jgi:hypothetical protein
MHVPCLCDKTILSSRPGRVARIDPAGNALEFKSFRDPEQLFAK